ncbi:MFS transporter [Streptacidiphilus cavernicola]|uniref:MFS transporter n=1 Tax=Streptacidiphilus cavernicola TaxID=3342716 RepID=A0ABV6W025_9ACTN
MPRRPLPSATLPLVTLFSSGYLAPYLLPTLVGRLGSDFGLTPTQAGAVGSAMLLASAAAGLGLAARVAVVGAVRLARIGLTLLVLGFGTAAAAPAGELPLLLVGCLLGGLGAGTATAVAAAGTAAGRDPHRVSVLGLLVTSAVAGCLYLTLPHLGGGHSLPFACIAGWAALALPWTSRLGGDAARERGTGRPAGRGAGRAAGKSGARGVGRVAQQGADRGTGRVEDRDGVGRGAGRVAQQRLMRRAAGRPLPTRVAGGVLAVGLFLWSLAQNSLWGVSGRIGLERAGLSAPLLGLVFALALGAGLIGTASAGSLGTRFGRALPIGLGTAAIAGCVALSATAHSAGPFAVGEICWNAVYPFVLSYLLALAARIDAGGRWAVLVGSASSLGVACGPITGTLLTVHAGFTVTGAVLGATLLLVALPMAAVAHAADRGPAEAAAPGVEPAVVAAVEPLTAPVAVPAPELVAALLALPEPEPTALAGPELALALLTVPGPAASPTPAAVPAPVPVGSP